MNPKCKRESHFECQKCREREEMLAAMPRAIDLVFINARRGVHPEDKERAIEIVTLYITMARVRVQRKLEAWRECGDCRYSRYSAVDLGEIEHKLQKDAEKEIRTCVLRKNQKSLLDAGECDERRSEPAVYQTLNQICFERFWRAVHNRRNGRHGTSVFPKTNHAAAEEKADPAAVEAFEQLDLDDDVLAAVNRLPKNERDVFLSKYISGMTLKGIASAKGVSESKISRLYSKARARIERDLGLDC